jgi:hypothetical protein
LQQIPFFLLKVNKDVVFKTLLKGKKQSARFTIEDHPDLDHLLLSSENSESFRVAAFEVAAKIRSTETEADSNRISEDELRSFVAAVVVAEAVADDDAAKKSTVPTTLEERKAASGPTILAKVAAKRLLVRRCCPNSCRPSF